jgi:uncharacterized protein YukE
MMSDGRYWVDPDEVDGAVGRLTAEALDIYNLARELHRMDQPSFSKAGQAAADAFEIVRQLLAKRLEETAQTMQETNMIVSQGMQDYRDADRDSARNFRNAGGISA